ncbi:type VII secretion target [Kutzneria sp. 744]|uniref:type VII secretion target n=1 Tax=Kutzneria sp. (strain 744) TaxID=345341 RepID=UPI0004AD0BE5|nr:type VII secretion target [Kutzneria sp. 744]
MSGVHIDPDWIASYAKTVSRSASELGSARDALKGAPLPADAFGQLGRNTGADTAYAQAAQTLSEQLARAVDALTAASESLAKTADHYGSHDQDVAALLKKAGAK